MLKRKKEKKKGGGGRGQHLKKKKRKKKGSNIGSCPQVPVGPLNSQTTGKGEK